MSDRLLKTHPLHAYARVALRHLQHGWQRLREFGHGLRVAGIASLSVGLGLFTYWAVPQAQDLFLEIFGSWGTATLYWMFFYGMVVVAWVLPVYLSSRWILARYNALAYTSTEDDLIPVPSWVVRVLPPLLGTLCMAAVLVGQWEAIVSAPQTGFVCESEVKRNAACLSKVQSFGETVSTVFKDWQTKQSEISPDNSIVIFIALSRLVENVKFAALLFTALTLPMLLVLFHAVTLARWPASLASRVAIGVTWGAGGGLTVFILWLIWTNRLITLDGSLGGFIGIAAIFLWAKLPGTLAAADQATMLSETTDALYNGIGPTGVALLALPVALCPIVLYFLYRVMRRSGAIAVGGARVSLRLSLCYFGLLLLGIAAASIYVISFFWTRLQKDLTDPFSSVGMLVLPVASAALIALFLWLLRRFRWIDAKLSASTIWPNGLFGGVLVVATLALLTIVLVDPLLLTRYIYRASLLPIMLGVWIPALTFFHALSVRTRVPLVLGFFAVVMIALPAIVGDPYTIRTLDQDHAPLRPTLQDSLARWAKANNCEAPVYEKNFEVPEARRCPPPIIVLAAGGASRSAFKVAEVLGNLANLSDTIDDGGELSTGLPPNFTAFQNRLFAISAVSGGALAAVTYQAMQAEAQLARTGASRPRPPCKKELPDSAWFGAIQASDLPQAPDTSWSSCMELMLSGDFLSPTMIGVIGADFLNMRQYGDRAATLEKAWERRFELVTGKDTLSKPMVALRNRVLAVDDRNWLPHLLINGTSVSTGRRIITSDLDLLYGNDDYCRDKTTARSAGICGSPFTDAYDLHDLLRGPAVSSTNGAATSAGSTPAEPPGPCKSCDVRLSTAATMSARFPVLSPHGTIRNDQGVFIDRVVDGGYFDNNGSVTAQELEEKLRYFHLPPQIILITSEPSATGLPCLYTDLPVLPARTLENTTLGVLSSPFNTFLRTRESRAALASLNLCKQKFNILKHDVFPTDGSFIHIGVEADRDIFSNKQLSMSWWLSKHVQRRLTLSPKKETWLWQALGLAPPPASQASQ